LIDDATIHALNDQEAKRPSDAFCIEIWLTQPVADKL